MVWNLLSCLGSLFWSSTIKCFEESLASLRQLLASRRYSRLEIPLRITTYSYAILYSDNSYVRKANISICKTTNTSLKTKARLQPVTTKLAISEVFFYDIFLKFDKIFWSASFPSFISNFSSIDIFSYKLERSTES